MPGKQREGDYRTPRLDLNRGVGALGRDAHANRIREALAARLFGTAIRVPVSRRYRITHHLGMGAMGTVWAAHDAVLDRPVAIKLVSCRSDHADTMERLGREARAMASLNHPNVVGVYDVGGRGHELHLVMELVDGEDLHRWLSRSVRGWRAVTEAFVQAGRGLAAAHAIGIVHRDFKPANVLRRHDGSVLVGDFGLAAPSWSEEVTSRSDEHRDGPLTRTHQAAGTPLFMAPEQLDGARADVRSDQYGYCAALYFALYRVPPFEARSLAALAEIKRRGPPPRPRSSGVPARLWPIVRRGLHPNPARRWPSISRLVEELEAATQNSHRGRNLLAVACASVVAMAFVPSAVDDSACAEPPVTPGEPRIEALGRRLDQVGVDLGATESVQASLRSLSTTLVEQHVRVCSGPPSAVQHRKAACLLESSRELDMVVDLVERGDDDVVAAARDLVAGISSPDRCKVVESTKGRAPAASLVSHADLRVDFRRVVLLERLGRYDEAMTEARALLKSIDEREASELRPRAIYALGVVHARLGQYAEAEEHWRRAYFTGWTAGEYDPVAQAAISLVDLHGVRFGDVSEALQWARHADAAIDRGHLSPEFRATLARTIGAGLLAAGRIEDALAHQRIALAQARLLWPADSPRIGPYLDDLAGALASVGRHDQALPLMEAAFEIVDREHEPDHPLRVGRHGNLGVILHRLGEYDEAQEHLDAALDLARRVFPAGHEGLARALTNRSNLHYSAGEYDEALALRNEALEIRVAALGEHARPTVRARTAVADAAHRAGELERARLLAVQAIASFEGDVRDGVGSREHGLALAVLGEVQAAVDELDGAEGSLRRSVEILGDVDPTTVSVRLALARVERALGRADEHVVTIETALELTQHLDLGPLQLAEAELALAEALEERGEHERARGLARRASEHLPDTAWTRAQRRRIDDVLAGS